MATKVQKEAPVKRGAQKPAAEKPAANNIPTAEIPVQPEENKETPADPQTEKVTAEPVNQKLAPYQKIAAQTHMDPELIAVIHNSVAKDTTVFELAYFLNVAKGLDLNPLNKEIWCYKDHKNNLVVFTGRDGFLKKAQQHPRYNGFRSGCVCKNDKFVAVVTTNSVEVKHVHARGDRGAIEGAWFLGYLKDGQPFYEWVDFSDYKRENTQWNKNPKPMIIKVAESHGLKKCFGITGVAAEDDFIVGNDGKVTPVSHQLAEGNVLNK